MIILAVDVGDARTGLAVCDRSELLASPAGVLQEKDLDALPGRVAEEAARLKAELVVVGYPKNMNNSVGERAEKCAAFARRLEELTGLETVLWDERSTTVSAHGFLNVTNTRGKKRKQVIDAVAATIILENYLQWRRHNMNQSGFQKN